MTTPTPTPISTARTAYSATDVRAALDRYNTGAVFDGVFRERAADPTMDTRKMLEQSVNDYFIRVLDDYSRGITRPPRYASFATAARENAKFLRARVPENAKRAKKDGVTTAVIPFTYKGTQPTMDERVAWLSDDDAPLIALAKRTLPAGMDAATARFLLVDADGHTCLAIVLLTYPIM
jgi:hypothetical protein